MAVPPMAAGPSCAHVVVGQVEQVLEFVEVQLAGVKGRVFGGVVLEVDDVDVDAGLLGVLLELDPFGLVAPTTPILTGLPLLPLADDSLAPANAR